MISTQLVHNTPSISHTHTRSLLNPTVLTNDYAPTVPNTKCHIPITSPSSTFPASPGQEIDSPKSGNNFDDILVACELPPPGPDYYAARRALWLAPRSTAQHREIEPSTSRQRLEKLLNSPRAVENDNVWNNGIENVWKGLNAGGRLRRRLPMALIIKVVHAAWLRDETWPFGAVAPEPDDVLLDDGLSPALARISSPPPPTLTEYSSGVTTPWLAVGEGDAHLDEEEVASGTVAEADC